MLHPKIDVQITLLTLLLVALVPGVAIAALVASTALFRVHFSEPYVALAIIAALLTLLVMARDAVQQSNLVGAAGLDGSRAHRPRLARCGRRLTVFRIRDQKFGDFLAARVVVVVRC